MQVSFTEHARERMAERGIPEEAVYAVLRNWDSCRPAPRSGRSVGTTMIYTGSYGGRNLKVYVLVEGRNPIRVQTAVWQGD
jgi:hypothetical protein